MTGAQQNPPDLPPAKGRPRDPLVGTVLDGRFQIEDILGSGGMSVVYKATQLRVNRHVAIKTLRVQLDDKPIYRERFQREISLLCSLSHPNIVTVYDCVIGPDDQPYVVMDYLRGRSLEQLIEQEGPLSLDRFARIAVQVCGALDYAHRQGVIHRDLKPGNIVLMDEEMDFVKVVDFGLAKLNLDNRKLTQSGELWGSPPYMSPEQCTSKPEDERSDIYSFGAVMYEMLAGKDPFHFATTVFELIQTHVSTPPKPIAEVNPLQYVPPQVEAVIFKAMAKDPKDRYQSGQQLKDALVNACADKSGGAGELRLLPSDNIRDANAERWLQGEAEVNQTPGTASGHFRMALDPMQGLSVDELFDKAPTAYGGAEAVPGIDERGDMVVEALSRSASDERWSKPGALGQGSLAAAAKTEPTSSPTPPPEKPEAPKPASIISGSSASTFTKPAPSAKPAAAMRSRMADAPAKTNLIAVGILLIVVVVGAAAVTRMFVHPQSQPSENLPANVQSAITPTATQSDDTEPSSTSTNATPASAAPQAKKPPVENHKHTPTVMHVETQPPQVVHKAHPVKPHTTAAAPARKPPQAATGKASPWDALQGLRK